MNLHPITWAILGLAVVGLWFILSFIVPVLLILTAMAMWQRTKSVDLTQYTKFKEVKANDRVRLDSVHRRLNCSGQDAQAKHQEASGL